MTAVPVTDMPSEYIVTAFSEDNYPSNKHYEITSGQMSIMRTMHNALLANKNEYDEQSSDDEETSPTPCSDMEEEVDEVEDKVSESAITIPTAAAAIARTRVTPTHQDISFKKSINIMGPNGTNNEVIFTAEQKRVNITMSDLDTVLENNGHMDKFSKITSMPMHTTPSLGAVFDDSKRVKLLEQEVQQLRKQKAAAPSNLDNFTKILFGKVPIKTADVNKRMVIVNYANLNNVSLSIEDLNDCSDEEIERMFKTIKQYNEMRKKKIIITNMIIIGITILEQVLYKIGFEEVKGLSADVTSEIIDVEIGDDCEAVANKIGFSNSPVFNIVLFIVKLFVKKMKII
ncbi:viral membrane formation [Pteropox virus]|uniref:Viral membrane formation n=1 Tax=Pteropox virus TaxID=1873698 RepID=A0A1B1MRM5_9POXV|nr:viral membrane formation [Pteropox virus]ANS71189.1 viral membrane formation [Pteropox virus]